MEEYTLEMRGIPRSRIIDYFLELDGERADEGRFKGQGWEVGVSEETLVALGSFRITATFVTFRCSKETRKKMMDEIQRHFLRNGGGG